MRLVAVTPRMTELAQLEELILQHCTRLVYYTELVTEQVDIHALLICGYTIDPTLTQLHHSRILSPEWFPVYPNGVSVGE